MSYFFLPEAFVNNSISWSKFLPVLRDSAKFTFLDPQFGLMNLTQKKTKLNSQF